MKTRLNKTLRYLGLLALVLLICSNTSAANSEKDHAQSASRGWYWYMRDGKKPQAQVEVAPSRGGYTTMQPSSSSDSGIYPAGTTEAPPIYDSEIEAVDYESLDGDVIIDAVESPVFAEQTTGSTQEDSPFGVQGAITIFPEQITGAGIGITREWIRWDVIQPEVDQWDWAEMDDTVRSANNEGMEILAYFTGTPDWAKRNPKCNASVCELKREPEDYMPKFQEFARAVTERYDGDDFNDAPGSPITSPLVIKYFEILNEVTEGVFFEQTDTNKYEEWLVAGYNGIKGEDGGNPNATVLIGAFVDPLFFAGGEPDPIAQAFIDNMLDNYSQYYDIVNFHSYSRDDNGIVETTQYIQGQMDFYGVDKPMWITETATLTSIAQSDWQDNIAKGVIRRYVGALGNDVEKVFWFPFVGEPTPDEDPTGRDTKTIALGWAFKGSSIYHPRSAYFAYKKMTETLEGSDWDNIEKVCEGADDIYIYKFTKYDEKIGRTKQIWVAWDDTPDYIQSGYGLVAKEITITGIRHNEVKITDAVPNYERGMDITDYSNAFEGRIWTVITSPSSGDTREVTIELGENPLFIEENYPPRRR